MPKKKSNMTFYDKIKKIKTYALSPKHEKTLSCGVVFGVDNLYIFPIVMKLCYGNETLLGKIHNVKSISIRKNI